METMDFFRSRIDTMIDLRSPLAVLATRIAWDQIEVVLAPKFEHEDRAGAGRLQRDIGAAEGLGLRRGGNVGPDARAGQRRRSGASG